MGELIRSDRYSAERVLEALGTVAARAGNVSEAARLLGIPKRTLQSWKSRYPQRYEQACEKIARQVEQRLAREYRGCRRGGRCAAARTTACQGAP